MHDSAAAHRHADWVLVASEAQARLYRQQADGSLQVFAGSPFLGELKARLGRATRRLLAGSHDADLTAMDAAAIVQRLRVPAGWRRVRSVREAIAAPAAVPPRRAARPAAARPA